MKYLPDQKPAVIRLNRTLVLLLLRALRDYVPALTAHHPAKLRVLRAFAKSLPQSLPYEVRIFAAEWELISTALRPFGSNPPSGSIEAKMYALYQRLRPHCRFETEQMQQRLLAAAKRRRLASWRGVYDHERDPSAPKISHRRG